MNKENALPVLTGTLHFSPLHGRLHEQKKVYFILSNKQEPPLRQPAT